MMNCTKKAAIFIPRSSLRLALFHSTPVLERKRRKSWNSEFNWNSRSRKPHMMPSFQQHFDIYTDYVLKNWENQSDEEDEPSSRGTSWFKQQYSKGSRKQKTRNWGNRHWSRGFQFCDDVAEETVFRNMFGGNGPFWWSFIKEQEPQWRRSSSNRFDYNGKTWRYHTQWDNFFERDWRNRARDDYDYSLESDDEASNLSSDRIALGLSAYGPLKLEDVKNAYRTCALKWHPDRHQGSSKAVAEEKFKHCSAAYQSLCDRLGAAE